MIERHKSNKINTINNSEVRHSCVAMNPIGMGKRMSLCSARSVISNCLL
jgi:hypothetical protein